jgi:glycosyltransferase involved in cell wall biosynthesis
MKVTAVVPTYNDEDVIGECLESLLNQTKDFDEIIVVDDGSTDSTREIVKKYPVKLIRIEHKERSHARNIGWKNAAGEIIAFIESDSVYDEKWVEEVLEGFKKGADAVIDRRALYKPKTFIARYNDEMFNLRYKNYNPFSAWAFKKEVLERLGGFDEDLVAAEDRDLGARLLASGYRIAFADKAIQYHKGEPTSLWRAIKRSWWFGKNMWGYYRKYPKKTPSLNLAVYSLVVILFFNPIVWFAYITILYIALFLRSLQRGLKPQYALASPMISIFSGITFNIASIYGLVERIFCRR